MNNEYIEIIKKLGLTILGGVDDNFKGNTKLTLIDNEGYKYFLSIANLRHTIKRNGILAKYFNNNPYTKDNIENYILKNNLPITIKEFNVSNATSNIKLICNVHNVEFEKTWNNIKNGLYSCNICIEESRRCTNGLKHSYEYIKEQFEKMDLKLLSKEYKDNESKLEFVCNNHKDKGSQYKSWGNIILKKHPCIYCSKELLKQEQYEIAKEKFFKEFNTSYSDKLILLDEYKGSKYKLKLHCKICNTTFHQREDHLFNGHISCECKVKSLGEHLIKEWLQKNNINFIQQYRIKDCRNKKPLPFDFAILNNKGDLLFLIEFQGKQHYIETGWTQDAKKSKESFIMQQINDNMKRDYCKTNNINLVEIGYFQIPKIESILLDLCIKNNLFN